MKQLITPSDLFYGDYFHKVLQIVNNVLHDRNICFDLVTEKDQIDTNSNCLLVVWSRDWMENGQIKDTAGKLWDQFVDKLSSLNSPVIWLTAVDQAHLDFANIGTNIKFLHCGGDIMAQMKEYPLIAPQREKSFDTKYVSHWISLSSAAHVHRILAACCLLGHDLGNQDLPENRGLLRISNHPIIGYESVNEYVRNFTSDSISWNQSQQQVLQDGFVKLQKVLNGGQPEADPYHGLIGLDNASNFDRSLRFLYLNSMVEIVNETTFFTKGIFVTEKFQNSVYGFNLPIILSNAGTVAYLRSHGFDMFDDIIDHGYDEIQDPIGRIFAAIEKNLRLLQDFDHTKRCYKHCLPRLEQNYQYIRQGMYDHFLQHFRQNLQHYLENEYNPTKQ